MFKASDYLISIVELESYRKDAIDVFTEEEHDELILHLAGHPELGDVIQGSGGIRKIRWRSHNQGKRGGARVIYYFRDLNMPVFLLAVYKKNEKINLTASELKAFRQLVDTLAGHYMNPKWEMVVRLTNEAG